VLLSLAELRKEKTLKKERAFPCTSFRKKKLLKFKRESTSSARLGAGADPCSVGLRFREATRPAAKADGRPRFAAANLADIKKRKLSRQSDDAAEAETGYRGKVKNI